MKMRNKFLAATLLLLTIGILSLAGCNTWQGFGKDVEKTGEKIQD